MVIVIVLRIRLGDWCNFVWVEIYWVKNSIMRSKLPQLLNFKEEDIDWIQCDKYARTGITKKICEVWNNGVANILKIAEIFKINPVTIRDKYYRQG